MANGGYRSTKESYMRFASSGTGGGPPYPAFSSEQGSLARSQVGRILAIEPDDEIRAAIDGLLNIHGCDVRTVPHYGAGLALMETWEPSLIFLDIDVLDMDVAQAVATLQAGREPPAAVVLVTRRVFRADEALRLGAVARIQTPFDVEEMLRLVARFAPCG
jgi:CheY-like chemotaxis protein